MNDSPEYVTFHTAWGWQTLIWSGERIVQLTLPADVQKAVGPVSAVSPRPCPEPPRWVQELSARIRDYFDGKKVDFLDVQIDTSRLSGFQNAVYESLRQVKRGSVVTYGELAAMVGRPGAARAVGGACARNPVPIIVPCHRVVSAAGGVGGFAGGQEMKRRMLEMEGVNL